ncbi:MAG: hypothetical protein ACXW1Y_09945, partial [Acidimicrobiia bacterium]
MKRLVAVSLGSLLLALLLPISVSAAEFEKYAIASADAFLSDYQAGAHADLTTSFRVTQKSSGAPFA